MESIYFLIDIQQYFNIIIFIKNHDARGLKKEEMGSYLTGTEVQFCKMKAVLEIEVVRAAWQCEYLCH